MNTLEKSFNNILMNMYVTNVDKRLRELVDPGDNDCKRWPFELLQNAKDSVSSLKEKRKINIEFIINNDEVKVIHDGEPFTGDSLMALLYKYSEGKEFNPESTGRFGTGFMTTHSLSKTVQIEGDIYELDGSIQGFSLTMYSYGINH